MTDMSFKNKLLPLAMAHFNIFTSQPHPHQRAVAPLSPPLSISPLTSLPSSPAQPPDFGDRDPRHRYSEADDAEWPTHDTIVA